VAPLVGGYPLEINANGSAYPVEEQVELVAPDARLPIEVQWRLIPQGEDSELQLLAGPPQTQQQMLLYTYNSASRPLDAEFRPKLRYILRGSIFIANVSGTFDGEPLWNSQGLPRRALSKSMGDNFTMTALPSVDRELRVTVLDRPEPPTARSDALTVDRRIFFAASIAADDLEASKTPPLQSRYDFGNFMQAYEVVQGAVGGFPVGQALQLEEVDVGQTVDFSLLVAQPQDWINFGPGVSGNTLSPAYYWDTAAGEDEYVSRGFELAVETSRRAIGDTGRTTTLLDVSIFVKPESRGGYAVLPPTPGSTLPGARERQWIMAVLRADDSGGNTTSVLLNITVAPFTDGGI